MSRIVSTEPIKIEIVYNEVSGACVFNPPTRPIAFPVLVKIFNGIMNQLADQFMTQQLATMPAGSVYCTACGTVNAPGAKTCLKCKKDIGGPNGQS